MSKPKVDWGQSAWKLIGDNQSYLFFIKQLIGANQLTHVNTCYNLSGINVL